jgi:hypothetical protein
MTELEKAWVAGFWEGDGTCGYYTVRRKLRNGKYTTNSRLTVTVNQVDSTPLHKLVQLFKIGTVRKHSNSFGFNPKGVISTWMLSCHSARVFLNTILPYVVSDTKRQQIVEALKSDAYDH